MEEINQLENFNRGFTLLELVVSIAIFAIIMTVASGIFASAIQSQTQVLGQQMAINNSSYSLEYMGRTLRMAEKDTTGSCIKKGCNFTAPTDSSIQFLTQDGRCTRFFLEDGRIREKQSTDESSSFDLHDLPFTPSKDKFEVKNLEFELNGQCQFDPDDPDQVDYLQPTVTILLEVEVAEGITFKTQTTITQRNLDAYR